MKDLVNIDLLTKINGVALQKPTKGIKIFKSYELKEGMTLDKLINKVLEDYPKTRLYYSFDTLKAEVLKSNNVIEGNYISVPCYIGEINLEDKAMFDKEKEEKALLLDEYQDYKVTDETYYNIACLYTNDNNEIIKLVSIIQELNDYKTLQYGDTIRIPNIEKYTILNGNRR